MLLHLSFINEFNKNIIKQFNYFSEVKKSQFVFFDNNYKEINITDNQFFFPKDISLFLSYFNTLEKYDAVIIHFLNPFFCNLILKYKSKKINWVYNLAGTELYSTNISRLKLYHPLTKKAFISNADSLYDMLISVKQKYITKSSYHNQLGRCLKRATHINTVIPEDFYILKRQFSFSAKYVAFNYADINIELNAKKDNKDLIKNILVGNSCTLSNNHLDTFHLIKGNDIGERKIIVPLNYGDLSIRNRILETGTRLFGEQFMPINDFLDFSKYLELLESCEIVIMNHLRQQALGTIFLNLWVGSIVLLNEQNPLFGFLKKNGFIIYSISKDLKSVLEKHNEILLECMEVNRKRLLNVFGQDAINNRTLNYIRIITKTNIES